MCNFKEFSSARNIVPLRYSYLSRPENFSKMQNTEETWWKAFCVLSLDHWCWTNASIWLYLTGIDQGTMRFILKVTFDSAFGTSRYFPILLDTFDMQFSFSPLSVARPGPISTLAFTTLGEEGSERSSTKRPINHPFNNKIKSDSEKYCKPPERFIFIEQKEIKSALKDQIPKGWKLKTQKVATRCSFSTARYHMLTKMLNQHCSYGRDGESKEKLRWSSICQ